MTELLIAAIRLILDRKDRPGESSGIVSLATYWRFSDYEESESQDREWIIAWGRQEIQEQIEADGDPYGRLFDTSYREEYWPQLRAAGFTEEKYPAFDRVGSVLGSAWRDMQHVHDPEAQALALEWEHR